MVDLNQYRYLAVKQIKHEDGDISCEYSSFRVSADSNGRYSGKLANESEAFKKLGYHPNIVEYIHTYFEKRDDPPTVSSSTKMFRYGQREFWDISSRNCVSIEHILLECMDEKDLSEISAENIYQNANGNLSTIYSSIKLVNWMLDMATAIEFMHSKDIIHGDFKARKAARFDYKI